MPTITWDLTINNTEHVVRLRHERIRREISVDGVAVERWRKWIDHGSRHFLAIDGQEFELAIVQTGATYAYFLLQDNIPIPSDKDRAKGKTSDALIKTRHLKDILFWQGLAHALNLPYFPAQDELFAFRHRLIGFYDGYLTLIKKIYLPNTNVPIWMVCVRHTPPISPDTGKRIWSDPRIRALFTKRRPSKDHFVHQQGFTLILLPIIKAETPDELAARVKIFLMVVSENTSALPDGICEGQACRHLTSDRSVVLVNGMPLIFCPDCIKAVPELGKQARELYNQAPNNLLPGVIVASGIALLGAQVWAAAGFFLGMIAVSVSFVIMYWIVTAMDKVGTKRTYLSFFIAVLFTFISVTLGHIETVFLIRFRSGSPFTLQTFLSTLDAIISNPRSLYATYIFTLLGSGFSLWSIWNSARNRLSRNFKPDIEVLPGTYL